MNPITIWEAHKCVIRGDLLARAAKAKRQYQQSLKTLIDKITQLEAAHKQSLATADLHSLTEARNQLLVLLGKQHRHRHMLSKDFTMNRVIKVDAC